MANAIKTIWTKQADGRTIEVAYNGFDCLLSVNGKLAAQGRPVVVNDATRKRMGLGYDIAMLIGKASIKEADAKAIREAMAKADAEIKASKTADLPGLAIAREAIERWADYHYQMSQMMETGRTPVKPIEDLDAIKAEYPAAYLYVVTERALSTASHEDKVADLTKALDILVNGGSIDEARKIASRWTN